MWSKLTGLLKDNNSRETLDCLSQLRKKDIYMLGYLVVQIFSNNSQFNQST